MNKFERDGLDLENENYKGNELDTSADESSLEERKERQK